MTYENRIRRLEQRVAGSRLDSDEFFNDLRTVLKTAAEDAICVDMMRLETVMHDTSDAPCLAHTNSLIGSVDYSDMSPEELERLANQRLARVLREQFGEAWLDRFESACEARGWGRLLACNDGN